MFICFREKYTMENIPDQTTLRKIYVDNCCQIIENIRKKVTGQKIWISIEETTDIECHFSHLSLSKSLPNHPGDIFLFNLALSEYANYTNNTYVV